MRQIFWRTLSRQNSRRAVSVVAASLIATVGLASLSTPAYADTNPAITGTSWLNGSGVNACSMTGTWDSVSCGDHNQANTVPVGSAWQCVELAQRVYKARGWYSGIFPNVAYAYQIYDQAGAMGMTAHANGDGIPVPGDMIIHNLDGVHGADGNNAGHVAVVDYVDQASVHVVEQNYLSAAHRDVYTLNGSTMSRTLNNGYSLPMPIRGYVHAPGNTNTNGGGGGGQVAIPWNFENLDGDPGSIGHNNADLGLTPSEIQFGANLHTFYYDITSHVLRHAYADASGWHFSILDGAGGATGTVVGNVGLVSAATVLGSTLHVFYYDSTHTSLRHAWSTDGTTWSYENVDGTASTITGHFNGNVGASPYSMVGPDGYLRVFYYDITNGDLRHAWNDASGWHFENLDGSASSPSGFSANLGTDPVAVSYSGTIQLFYYDITNGNLRHAFKNGTGWHFETLDGQAGTYGGVVGNVGGHPAATVFGTTLQTFYYDATKGDLFHAFSDATGWHFENLDGNGGLPSTRIVADVGLDAAAVTFDGHVQLLYYDRTSGNLRHSWSQ